MERGITNLGGGGRGKEDKSQMGQYLEKHLEQTSAGLMSTSANISKANVYFGKHQQG
jgi:hypothetical protein